MSEGESAATDARPAVLTRLSRVVQCHNTGAQPSKVPNTLRTYNFIPGSVLRAQWALFAGEKVLMNLDKPRPASSAYGPQDLAAYGPVDEVGTAVQRTVDTVRT